jgi:hypothetical protein
MFYEEKIIDGRLYFKESPDAVWKLSYSKKGDVIYALLSLPDDITRKDVFRFFCTNCGCVIPDDGAKCH